MNQAYMEKMHRPLGVTIIAILTIISGILLLLGGVSLIAIGALISVTPVDTSATTTNSQPIAQFFGVISAAIGSVLLAIGIGYLRFAIDAKNAQGQDQPFKVTMDGHGLSWKQ